MPGAIPHHFCVLLTRMNTLVGLGIRGDGYPAQCLGFPSMRLHDLVLQGHPHRTLQDVWRSSQCHTKSLEAVGGVRCYRSSPGILQHFFLDFRIFPLECHRRLIWPISHSRGLASTIRSTVLLGSILVS